jgi:hypothetical protein
MPKIVQDKSFDGAEERARRLGLTPLLAEITDILTNFELLVEEKRDSNGGAAIRHIVDERFRRSQGWANKSSGGVDWTKCHAVNGTQVCIGVEIQLSARSDLLIIDVAHLRDDIISGQIDVGVIVVPSDRLAVYLTDRVARFADAVRAVERARAEDLPLIILGLEHDASGPPLAKQKTRQGKG